MPDLPDDTQNLTGTQPVSLPEWKPTSQRVSTPASGHVQQPTPGGYDRRKRKPNERNRSALYLPVWSVGLMLLLVFGIVGAIVTLVITLGGQSAPGGQPHIVIITAQPSDTPSVQPTATSAGVQPLPSFQGPLPTFGLEGPTLVPIILSPTPVEIIVGSTVIVNVDSLNIRIAPGINQKLVTTAVKNDRFTVLEGPQQADNLTWWHIHDPNDPTRDGWAASDYLDVAIQ